MTTHLQPTKLTALLAAARLAIEGELGFAPNAKKPFIETLLIMKINLRTYFLNKAMVSTDIWPLLRGDGADKERVFDVVMKMTQAFDLEVEIEGLDNTLHQSMASALSYTKGKATSGESQILGMDNDTASKLANIDEVRDILIQNSPMRFLLFCTIFMSRLGYKPPVGDPPKDGGQKSSTPTA